jgi:hypothetical protein
MQSDIVVAENLYVNNTLAWGPGRRAVLRMLLQGEYRDNQICLLLNMKRKTVSARRVELWRLGLVRPVRMEKGKRQREKVWGIVPGKEAEAQQLVEQS